MSDDNSDEFEQGSPILAPFSPNNRKRKTREKKKLKVLEMAASEIDVPTIAKAVELSETTVRSYLKKFEGVFKNLDKVPDFRKAKADILSAGQLTVLETALSEAKISKASFLSLVQGAEIMNKIERLDLGKTTENHGLSIFGRFHHTTDAKEDWIDANPAE